MEQDEEALWFASLEMEGEEEKRTLIPKKKKEQEPQSNSFKLGGFVAEMEEYASFEGEECSFVSYQHPLPSYDTMNQSQKNWYFYWRSQVRQGIYLPTDTDYVYILAFECILKVGEWELETVNRVLLGLLGEYGDLNPRLRKNLEVWALDFCLLEPISPVAFLNHVSADTLDGQSLNLIFHKCNQIFPLFLPASILTLHYERKEVFEQLERYKIREIVEEILEKTFECADYYCHKEKNKRLLQIYGTEKKETYARFCYQSGNLLWKKPTLELTVQNHFKYQKIFLFLGFFLDFTVYNLGKLWDIDTKAPDSPLGSGLEAVITKFLKEQFSEVPDHLSDDFKENLQLSIPLSPSEKKTANYSHIRLEDTIEKLEKARLKEKEKRSKLLEEKRKKVQKKPLVQLDFSQIDQLRASSDQVRASLEVLEQKHETVDLSLLAPVKKEENQVEKSPFSLNLDLIDSLRKDSDEVRQALTVEEDLQDDETVTFSSKNDENVKIQQNSPVKLDEKVESCVEKVELIPEENLPSPQKSMDDYALPEELQVLCNQLPEHLRRTLTLISQENWEELEHFSMEQFSMTALLVDEINALSVEYIGDILLETREEYPTFLEEYQVLSHFFKE